MPRSCATRTASLFGLGAVGLVGVMAAQVAGAATGTVRGKVIIEI